MYPIYIRSKNGWPKRVVQTFKKKKEQNIILTKITRSFSFSTVFNKPSFCRTFLFPKENVEIITM